MTRKAIAPLVVLAGFTATVFPCSSRERAPQQQFPIRHLAFDSVFQKVREFRLEESLRTPITAIRHVRRISGDRFLVTDRAAGGVRIHARDGSLIRVLGRFGKGPGEFEQPMDALEDEEGWLYVTDTSPRVTRFTSHLDFDTLFTISAYQAHRIERAGPHLALGVWIEGPEAERVFLVSKEGYMIRRFHRTHPLIYEVPYWISFFGEEMTVTKDRIYVANEFLYPLYEYDTNGDLVTTFGAPPESWIEAPRPEYGAFVGPEGMAKLVDWLRSFTVIRDIGVYRDSLLFVIHGRHAPESFNFHIKKDYGLDIYNLQGKKLFEDIQAIGNVLRVEDYVYVQLAEPPEGWIIGVYELRKSVAPS